MFHICLSPPPRPQLPTDAFSSGRDTGDREWTITGAGGCTLAFKTTRVGTFNELFGLMMLSVPRALVSTGTPRLSVVGEPAGNDDYYMTFQEPVRSWARVTAEEARFKDGSRVLNVEVSRIGNAAPMVVRAGGQALWHGIAGTGHSSVLLPVREAGSDLQVIVEVDTLAVLSQRVAMTPVRAWEIHLLPHSHVDVGYSDPQAEVERKQWKNLRDAVELAAKTRDLPPEARFKWNVEGLWSVESYLAQASAAAQSAARPLPTLAPLAPLDLSGNSDGAASSFTQLDIQQPQGMFGGAPIFTTGGS